MRSKGHPKLISSKIDWPFPTCKQLCIIAYMQDSRNILEIEALAAANAASQAGLSQLDVAIAVGASQSQVSRVFSGKSLRRSKNFEKICIYAFESLDATQSANRPTAAANHDLTTALDAVWDGSDQHAKALAVVIRSLGGLNLRKAPNARKQST